MKTYLAVVITLLLALISLQLAQMVFDRPVPLIHCPGADCNQYHVGIENGNEVQIMWRGQHVATFETEYLHGIDSAIFEFEKLKAGDHE